MLDLSGFKYCPHCASRAIHSHQGRAMQCDDCGLRYYHNTATAVGVLIEYQGGLLLTQRARDPQAGLWDFPGGFVEYNETLEQALRREVQEELQLSLPELRYLGSCSNNYLYRDINYITSDIYFVASMESLEGIQVQDDVRDFHVFQQGEIKPKQIAFESVSNILSIYGFLPSTG